MKRNIIVIISGIIFIGLIYNQWIEAESYKKLQQNFTKSIVRNYNNDFEKELIAKAENIPPKDGTWWCGNANSPLLRDPDSVNIEAIEYYSKLIDGKKENKELLKK